jgi:fibronectin type 3 domain-containing protein
MTSQWGGSVLRNNGVIIFLVLSAMLSCVTQDTTIVPEVPTPAIDTVSQGIFTDYIRIDWRTDAIGISRFQIYRSSTENGQYELLTVVDAAQSFNFFYDSVTTDAIYYYKITAIDAKGHSSQLSPGKHGFILTLPTPSVLSLEEHVDHVALFWTSYRGADAYAVYRSALACTTGMTRIGRTQATVFRDSIGSYGLSFYTLAALDSAGHEVAKSNCAWGRLQDLPAPTGGKVLSDLAPHTLLLQWDSVTGSREYILYRSSTYCPKADSEYIRTKSPFFRDSLQKAGYYYYSIAAVNNAGRASPMSECLRGAIDLLTPPDSLKASFDEYPTMIVLSWKALSDADHYVIYRAFGSGSSKMEKIDSSTISTVYKDSVPTSDTCRYIVAGVDSLGIEGTPSACVAGRVKLLPPPAGIKASIGLYIDKVRISWEPVTGANGYIYYRGKSNVSSLAVPVDTVTSLFDFDSVSTTSLYYYWVEARDRLGPGKRSGYAWGRTFISPQLFSEALDDSTFTLTWETDTTSTKWKYIYRFSYNADAPSLVDSTMNSSYAGVLPLDYQEYFYYIVTKTAVGDSAMSNSVYHARRPPAPTGLTASGAADGVYLQWNGIQGIADYIILRSDSVSDSTEYLDETTDTLYVDYSATAGRYYYQVKALSAGGESPRSNKVTAGIVNPTGRRP